MQSLLHPSPKAFDKLVVYANTSLQEPLHTQRFSSLRANAFWNFPLFIFTTSALRPSL